MSGKPNKPQQSEIIELLRALNHKQDAQSEALTDIRVSIAKQEAQFEAHTQQDAKMCARLENLDEKLAEYNHQLAIHIEGVNQLKVTNNLLQRALDERTEALDKRVEAIEASDKWYAQTKQRLITLGKIIGAVATIGGAIIWVVNYLKSSH